jgi:hypothetical protein
MQTILVIMRLLHLLEEPENRYKRLAYTSVIALLPVGMLLLQSIDQLTIKDIALILLLAGIAFLYVGRLRIRTKVE